MRDDKDTNPTSSYAAAEEGVVVAAASMVSVTLENSDLVLRVVTVEVQNKLQVLVDWIGSSRNSVPGDGDKKNNSSKQSALMKNKKRKFV